MLGNHGKEGKRIMRGTLPRVPGVTQGVPLSPHIFNFVLYVIVCHWVGIMDDKKAVPDGLKYTVAEKAALFYADDNIIEF